MAETGVVVPIWEISVALELMTSFFSLYTAIPVLLAALGAASIGVSFKLNSYSGTESPLATLFIESATHTFLEAGIFLILCALFFFAYLLSERVRTIVRTASSILSHFLQTLPSAMRHAIIFLCIALFLFALNAPGIVEGYFHSDDFAVFKTIVEHSPIELLSIPYSDHAVPLFWLQYSAFYYVFGTNPLPYNLFLLFLCTLLIWSAYTLLRTLQHSAVVLYVLLSFFGATVLLSEFLAGFYTLSITIEITAFFLLSLLCYVKTQSAVMHPSGWRVLSLLFLFWAMWFDISGIWTPGAYVLFMYLLQRKKQNTWSVVKFLRLQWVSIFGAGGIFVSFFLYLGYLYTLPQNTFLLLSGQHHLSLATLAQLYKVFSAGVIAQFLLPSAGLIISQPRFVTLLPLWDVSMGIFLLLGSVLIYLLVRLGRTATILEGIFYLLLVVGTGILTAVGRPTTQVAAFFPVQQVIMPFFWLVMFLAIAASEYIARATVERRNNRLFILAGVCVLILSVQHIFTFYNTENVREVTDSMHAVERLQQVFVPALARVALQSKENIYIPDLRGSYINTYSFDRDSSQYVAFVKLPDTIRLINVRHGSYAASTSPEFIRSLKTDEGLRSLYLSPVTPEIIFGTTTLFTSSSPKEFQSDGAYTITLSPQTITTAKDHVLVLDLAVPSSSRTLIQLAYKNAFSTLGTNATIRIDQFSHSIPFHPGRFLVQLDLYQMYSFALSPSVSDITLTLTTPGPYKIYGYHFGSL